MDKSKAKNRIQKLREEISRLRHLYHVENAPNVTDDVYESLTRELNELEQKYPEYADPNSSIHRVAGAPLASFKKVAHKVRMLSMNDVFSMEELEKWEARISKLISLPHSYFCELKLDGLSASLIYEDGKFIQGATRGDGFIGEDITENLKMIESVPLVLPLLRRREKTPSPSGHSPLARGEVFRVEVRGEVIMPKKAWVALNKIQESKGLPLFANTRNAAAGSLRQLDPKIVKERKLEFFAWDILIDDEKVKLHSEKHRLLREFGFTATPYESKAKNLKEVELFIEKIGKVRQDLPFGTDGMVISVDELALQESLGIVGKAPRYMVAYKYPAERSTTIVTDISVNIGRTGAVTPLAHFNPTLVAGSTISKATLHNMDQIERLDIRVGDTVVIQKAGDVIPEVVEVLKDLRTGKEKKFKMPEFCPVCANKIERKAGGEQISSSQGPRTRGAGAGARPVAHRTLLASSSNTSVAYFCTNKNCPARSRRGLQHFVNIFEIYEVGPKILDRLKDEGLISDAADLFTLERSDLSGLERFGEKSAENIISSIEAHKKIPLWRFIYALGIIHVGEQTARDLADHFGSLDKLMQASLEGINNIENIGPVVSESIYEFFHNDVNKNFINKILENGVTPIKEKAKSQSLKGRVFVLTGTLPTLSREDAKKKIIENGGTVASSVSSKTSYVLAGENPGSKYDDAKKLNIKILSEQEFLKML